MTENRKFYHCKTCGNLVQIMHAGNGDIVCCGEKMECLEANKELNELGEKHSPKIETIENKRFARVIKHPAVPEHYITFLQVHDLENNVLKTKFFNFDENPILDISDSSNNINLYAYCNIHGLWEKYD